MQMTPHIFDNGESIFNYEYLRKFEANIAKALTVVQGTCTKLIYEKKSKISVSLPCQYICNRKGHQRMSSNICNLATIFRKFYNMAVWVAGNSNF